MKNRYSLPTILFLVVAVIIMVYLYIITKIHGGLYNMYWTVITELFLLCAYSAFLLWHRSWNIRGEVVVEKNLFAVCLLLTTFAIQAASTISYPFQAYRDTNTTLDGVVGRQKQFAIQLFLMILVFSGVSALLRTKKIDFNRRIQRNIPRATLIPIAINLIFGLIFLLTPGATAAISIKGHSIIVGLPLLAWMLFSFSLYLGFYQYVTHDRTEKIPRRFWIEFAAILLSLVILVAGYAHRNEFGILIFMFLTILLWAFLEPHKMIKTKKGKVGWYSFWIGVVAVCAAFASVTYNMYKHSYDALIAENKSVGDAEIMASEQGILYDLGSKIARVFLDTGVKFIKQAGAFGSSDYVYDAAANNDYSLGLQVHNFGIVWFAFLIILVLLTAISGALYFSKNENYADVMKTTEILSFYCILLMLVYPILSNIGLIPIIGVSAFAAGYSNLHAVLCAILLAFVLYERRSDR